jgi:hypothetical protein
MMKVRCLAIQDAVAKTMESKIQNPQTKRWFRDLSGFNMKYCLQCEQGRQIMKEIGAKNDCIHEDSEFSEPQINDA